MKKISSLLLVGALLGAGFFAAGQAVGGQQSDPTAASAWKAGNEDGGGNFLSYCMPCHGDTGKGDGMLDRKSVV